MRLRSEARGVAIVETLESYREQRDRAGALEEPKRERKIAQLAAAERRELEGVGDRHALESFVSWAVRRRREIERDVDRLERIADRDEMRRTDRRDHEQRRELKLRRDVDEERQRKPRRGLRR